MFCELRADTLHLKTAIKNPSTGLVMFDPILGPIYTDTVTGTRYTITVVDGTIEKEIYLG